MLAALAVVLDVLALYVGAEVAEPALLVLASPAPDALWRDSVLLDDPGARARPGLVGMADLFRREGEQLVAASSLYQVVVEADLGPERAAGQIDDQDVGAFGLQVGAEPEERHVDGR